MPLSPEQFDDDFAIGARLRVDLVQKRYECELNPATNQVLDARARPGRL